MNAYEYTLEHGVHCFRFVPHGESSFASFMEHVAQITEQAQGKLCVLADMRNKGEEVGVFEVLSAIRMVERRSPQRPPVRVAVIERDLPVVKTIRVIHTLIGRTQDRFHVFLPDEADAALAWLMEEAR
ncbi:MAG: hypothetical protein SNJ83_08975 [Aggregatilineales bacterium]